MRKIPHNETTLKAHLLPVAKSLLLLYDKKSATDLILKILNENKSISLNKEHLEAYLTLLNRNFKDLFFTSPNMMLIHIKAPRGYQYLSKHNADIQKYLKDLEKAGLIIKAKTMNGRKVSKSKKGRELVIFTIKYPPLTLLQLGKEEVQDVFDAELLSNILTNYIYKNDFSCFTDELRENLPKSLEKLSAQQLQRLIGETFFRLGIALPNPEVLTAPVVPDDFDRTQSMSSEEKELFLGENMDSEEKEFFLRAKRKLKEKTQNEK